MLIQANVQDLCNLNYIFLASKLLWPNKTIDVQDAEWEWNQNTVIISVTATIWDVIFARPVIPTNPL